MQQVSVAESSKGTSTSDSLAFLSRLAGQRLASISDATDAVLRAISCLLGMRTSWASRIDKAANELCVTAAYNEPLGCDVVVGSKAPLPDTFCSAIAELEDPRPVVIEDVRADPHFMHSQAARAFPNIGSYIGVPIVLSDGAVFGTLCASDPQPKHISQREAEFLTILSRLLATQIERDREIVARTRAEERYRLLAEQGTDVLHVIAPDGTPSYVSPSVERILGYSVQEYLQLHANPIATLVHRDDKPIHDEAYAAALSGSHREVECRLHTKQRGDRWCHLTYSPLTTDDGERVGTRALLRDIHEQWSAQQQLRESERRFQKFMDESPVIAYMKDSDGRYVYANHSLQKLFGVSVQSQNGKTDSEWLPADIARTVRDHDRAVMADGRTQEYFEMIPLPDGTPKYWLSSRFPFTDESGRTYIGGVSIDITERQQQHLDQARFAAIVQSSNDAIIGKNLDGIITSWNPAAEHLYGYQAQEIIGRSVETLVPPGMPNDVRDFLARVNRGERIDHYETCRQAKDGRILDVALTISPIFDSGGEVVGAATIARDVTERKRLLEERDRLHAELREEILQTAEVQARLLPRVAPNIPNFAFAATCLPAREVGGDFFDWSNDGNTVRLSLGDVMGKGMPAALLMATARASLRSVAHMPPSDAVAAVNQALSPDLEETDAFITLFHAELDRAGKVSFADAGHGMALVLRRNGSIEELRGRGLPIGILSDTTYVQGTTCLNPGDTLIVYSDGLPDSRPDIRLDAIGVASQCAGLKDVHQMLDRLITLARGAGKRPDDLTLVLVHHREEAE